ncbi:MAG: hypothetical protein A2W90_02605 [Bacteroidetes bacterium GWF2_42_66]|nr:MAG: hypothetical protein A2W89_16090 [Bacteroidetes bacterium GWE2_42_39]OFY42085.1 MAG: hypothetical protein A2W90_02605 [Bacteroidetes bacterium GWF2_42_66]HBL77712.1 hypothetical protein [Prolixibacteraceae bacterium]HCB62841.1 hypothetical protein [Bacteroidales bacterium]
MALGKRLSIYSTDIIGGNTTINVYLEGYTGAAVERESTESPLQLQMGDNTGESLPEIYGTQTDIALYAENDFEFLDLFTASARDVFVEAIKNDTTTIFKGFIEPGKWSEPLAQTPYNVKLVAFCGLGPLKDEPFTDDEGAAYEGRKTKLEIIRLCLDKTGHAININTAWNIRETTAGAGDPLTQEKLDIAQFIDLSCYEVLQHIVKGGRIFQRLGEWWVVTNNNLRKTSVAYYKYNSAGVYQSASTFNPRATGFWFEDEPRMDMQSALKQLTVKQDYGYKANLLKNGNFDDIGSSAWIAVGVTPEIRNLNEDGDKFVYLPGKQKPADPANLTNGYKQSIYVSATSDFVALKTKFALMGAEGNSAYMYMMIKLETDTDTYYIRQFGNMDTKQIVYDWATWLQPAKPYITMKYHYSDNFSYNINPDKVPAWPWNIVPDKFEEISINIEGIPADGVMTVMLFVAYTNDVAIAGSCWTGVNLQLQQDSENTWETSTQFLITNNRKNNLVPDDVEMLIGTVPAINNRNIIYQGGITLAATGASVNLFQIDGETGSYTYAELIGRLLSSEIRKPRQIYQVRNADMPVTLAMAITDDTNPDRVWLESGATYDDRMLTIEGQYIELLTVDLTASDVGPLTVDETKGYEVQNTSPKTKDYDEKVSIINAEGVEVLAPAKLYNKYFEAEITEAGTVAIKTKDRLIQRNYIDPDITESATTVDAIASGDNAIAIGEGNEAYNYGEIVLGRFATIADGSQTTWVETDRAGVIGVGTATDNRLDVLSWYNNQNAEFEADLTVKGDLHVIGDLVYLEVEEVRIKDNMGVINYGETGAGITAGFAGWEADRGSLENYRWGFDEARDRWVIGEAGTTLQAVATITDSPTDQAIVYFDATDHILKPTAVLKTAFEYHLADVASYSAKSVSTGRGQILNSFTSDAKGHVTGISLRSLLAADLPSHSHTTSDISNLSSYTGFDARYYTESEITTILAGYSLTSHNHSGVYEPVLGNPSADGYLLSSTAAGVRSWVAQYSHPTLTAFNVTIDAGWMFSNIQVNAQGHLTSISTRVIAENDIPALAISKITGLSTQLSGKQPIDADLTAIAALAGTDGLLRKMAADTWSLDTNAYATTSQLHDAVSVTDSSTVDFTISGQQITASVIQSGLSLASLGERNFSSLASVPANITAFGGLANASGWLKNNGSGGFSYSTPSYSDVGAAPATHSHLAVDLPANIAYLDAANVFTANLNKFQNNSDGTTSIRILNTGTGSSQILLGEAATGGTYGYLSYLNSGYTASGIYQPATFVMQGSSTGGLQFSAPYGTMKFAVGGTALSNNVFTLSTSSANYTVPIVTTSTVQATTGKFTNLTNGYIPYHVSDASGLANSFLLQSNGTNIDTESSQYNIRFFTSGFQPSGTTRPAGNYIAGLTFRHGLEAVYESQLAFSTSENLYLRAIVNGVLGSWKTVYHSGNSNLSTVNWSANNITASSAINASSYQFAGTELKLDAHKSGSIGALGTLYVSAGASSTPTWTAKSSINLADFNNNLGNYGGFLTTETDPVFSAWNKSTGISITHTQISDWTTATASFLTSYTETDPIYIASTWYTTTNNSSNWNTAYGWGNHAGLYAAASHSHLAADLPSTIMYEGENISLLNNNAGYITGITKSMIEAQLTGAITSHTHNYDNYQRWLLYKNTAGSATYTTVGSWNASEYLILKEGTGITLGFSGSEITISASSGMVYPGAGIAVSTGSGWGTSITNNSVNWDTAFGWGNHAGLYAAASHSHLAADLPSTIMYEGENISLLNNNAGYITGITKAMIEAQLTGAITSHTHSYDLYQRWLLYKNTAGSATYTTVGSWNASEYLILKEGTGIILGFSGSEITISASSGMVYPGAGIAVSTGSGWGTSIIDNSSSWNTAFGWGNHAGLYAAASHNHTGTYEPVITKSGSGYAYWNAGTASWAFSDLNSYGWYLFVDGTQQKTVSWGTNVKFAAGTNVSLAYASDTITISASASGGSPGGSSGTIQYNNSGSFGGFGSWDGSTMSIGNLYAEGYGIFYDYPAQSYFKIDNSTSGTTTFNTGNSAVNLYTWLTANYLSGSMFIDLYADSILIDAYFILQPKSISTPGEEGEIRYDFTTHKHYGYDGSNWHALY